RGESTRGDIDGISYECAQAPAEGGQGAGRLLGEPGRRGVGGDLRRCRVRLGPDRYGARTERVASRPPAVACGRRLSVRRRGARTVERYGHDQTFARSWRADAAPALRAERTGSATRGSGSALPARRDAGRFGEQPGESLRSREGLLHACQRRDLPNPTDRDA